MLWEGWPWLAARWPRGEAGAQDFSGSVGGGAGAHGEAVDRWGLRGPGRGLSSLGPRSLVAGELDRAACGLAEGLGVQVDATAFFPRDRGRGEGGGG